MHSSNKIVIPLKQVMLLPDHCVSQTSTEYVGKQFSCNSESVGKVQKQLKKPQLDGGKKLYGVQYLGRRSSRRNSRHSKQAH